MPFFNTRILTSVPRKHVLFGNPTTGKMIGPQPEHLTPVNGEWCYELTDEIAATWAEFGVRIYPELPWGLMLCLTPKTTEAIFLRVPGLETPIKIQPYWNSKKKWTLAFDSPREVEIWRERNDHQQQPDEPN